MIKGTDFKIAPTSMHSFPAVRDSKQNAVDYRRLFFDMREAWIGDAKPIRKMMTFCRDKLEPIHDEKVLERATSLLYGKYFSEDLPFNKIVSKLLKLGRLGIGGSTAEYILNPNCKVLPSDCDLILHVEDTENFWIYFEREFGPWRKIIYSKEKFPDGLKHIPGGVAFRLKNTRIDIIVYFAKEAGYQTNYFDELNASRVIFIKEKEENIFSYKISSIVSQEILKRLNEHQLVWFSTDIDKLAGRLAHYVRKKNGDIADKKTIKLLEPNILEFAWENASPFEKRNLVHACLVARYKGQELEKACAGLAQELKKIKFAVQKRPASEERLRLFLDYLANHYAQYLKDDFALVYQNVLRHVFTWPSYEELQKVSKDLELRDSQKMELLLIRALTFAKQEIDSFEAAGQAWKKAKDYWSTALKTLKQGHFNLFTYEQLERAHADFSLSFRLYGGIVAEKRRQAISHQSSVLFSWLGMQRVVIGLFDLEHPSAELGSDSKIRKQLLKEVLASLRLPAYRKPYSANLDWNKLENLSVIALGQNIDFWQRKAVRNSCLSYLLYYCLPQRFISPMHGTTPHKDRWNQGYKRLSWLVETLPPCSIKGDIREDLEKLSSVEKESEALATKTPE